MNPPRIECTIKQHQIKEKNQQQNPRMRLRSLSNIIKYAQMIRKNLERQITNFSKKQVALSHQQLSTLIDKNQNIASKALQMLQQQLRLKSFSAIQYKITDVEKDLKHGLGKKVNKIILDKIDITETSKVNSKMFGRFFINMNITHLLISSKCRIDLLGITECLTRLISLEFYNCEVNSNTGKMISRYLYRLRHLQFQNTNIDTFSLEEIVNGCRTIQVLYLRNNKSLSQSALRVVAKSRLKLITFEFTSDFSIQTDTIIGLASMGIRHNTIVDTLDRARGLVMKRSEKKIMTMLLNSIQTKTY